MNTLRSPLCRNEVRFDDEITSERLDEILAFIQETPENFAKRNAQGYSYVTPSLLDFNNVMPLPGSIQDILVDLMKMTEEQLLEKHSEGRTSLERYCLSAKWHTWGTTENAMNVVWIPQLRTLIFDTMSQPAIPVVSEIHGRFPETRIEFEYYQRADGFIGGCEFIPEKDWSPEDFVIEEAHSLEERNNSKRGSGHRYWAARDVYNPWSTLYMGFKGG